MNFKNNILETIGNTPLVKINNINVGFANVFAKVEFFNPAGSIKDRVAYNMIKSAQDSEIITKNKTTIIEPTSGNTGIGLALVCAVLGYDLILVMPDNMSKERQDILRAYNAKIELTSASLGMKGCIDRVNQLKSQFDDVFIPSQFDNPNNNLAHYYTTANEIYNDLDGNVDVVVGGIGTGGTICGVAKRLKEIKNDVEIVGFEPKSSPLITQGYSSTHKIQGIGANFIPKNLDISLIDKILTVDDNQSIEYTKLLAQKEGIFCGISSGAAISVADELSKNEKYRNKNIVAILPDSGSRYLSCGIF